MKVEIVINNKDKTTSLIVTNISCSLFNRIDNEWPAVECQRAYDELKDQLIKKHMIQKESRIVSVEKA